MLRPRTDGVGLAVLLVLALTAPAAAEDTLRVIAFAPGQTRATVHRSLVRGDADLWSIAGRAGQTAEIRVTSVENNVSFRLYQPPARAKRGDDGLDIDGPELAGIDPVPGIDAGAGRHWRGTLPRTGRYFLVLSGDRGNATYDLSVTIK